MMKRLVLLIYCMMSFSMVYAGNISNLAIITGAPGDLGTDGTITGTLLELFDEVEAGFQGTFTSLNTLLFALCDPTIITQADITTMTYTISQPGLYVLAENIDFAPATAQPAIYIDSDDVVLEFCNHTLEQTNATSGVDAIHVPGRPFATRRENVIVRNGTIHLFTNKGIVVGTNTATPANTAVARFTISNMDIDECAVSAIELVGTSGAGIFDANIINSRIINCSTTVGATVTVRGEYLTGSEFNNVTVSRCGSPSTTALNLINLENSDRCLFTNIKIRTSEAITLNCARFNNVANSTLTGLFVLGNTGQACTGVAVSGTSNGILLRDSTVQDNVATNLKMSAYSFQTGTINNNIVNNLAFNNLASGTTANSHCVGFDCDRITFYSVLGNRATLNRATGDGGANYAAGFNIYTSTGVIGSGVKNCSFRDNVASYNNGFVNTRSYGFRVISDVTGNTQNAYLNNIALTNGVPPLGNFQITDNSGPDSSPGGVYSGSIRDGQLDSINSINDRFSNFRFVFT